MYRPSFVDGVLCYKSRDPKPRDFCTYCAFSAGRWPGHQRDSQESHQQRPTIGQSNLHRRALPATESFGGFGWNPRGFESADSWQRQAGRLRKRRRRRCQARPTGTGLLPRYKQFPDFGTSRAGQLMGCIVVGKNNKKGKTFVHPGQRIQMLKLPVMIFSQQLVFVKPGCSS